MERETCYARPSDRGSPTCGTAVDGTGEDTPRLTTSRAITSLPRTTYPACALALGQLLLQLCKLSVVKTQTDH
jgi:hypothetical protein